LIAGELSGVPTTIAPSRKPSEPSGSVAPSIDESAALISRRITVAVGEEPSISN
jgi:hypothetical protein